jgi:hypothetical protein
MTRRQRTLTLGLAGVLAAAAGLSACGKQGVLEQPPPLFGSRARAEYEASKKAEAAAAERRAAQNKAPGSAEAEKSEDSPPTKRSVQDPAQRLTPASRAPIQGAPNPFGGPVSTTPGN